MLKDAVFHHVGVASKSIEATSAVYIDAGFHVTKIIHDPIQNVYIAFLERKGAPLIELVEPVDEKSPVNNILKKVGVSAYHFCYEVDDIYSSIALLEEKDYRLIVEPVGAIAFSNRKICFLYHLDAGLIELVEK
jgi:methylmalonyl-CoA/ethylmalonyl-CoA epimerase